MVHRNQRGQILIESVFIILTVATILMVFQAMIDNQKLQANKYRLSKYKKDKVYDSKTSEKNR